eukprot:g6369.t1
MEQVSACMKHVVDMVEKNIKMEQRKEEKRRKQREYSRRKRAVKNCLKTIVDRVVEINTFEDDMVMSNQTQKKKKKSSKKQKVSKSKKRKRVEEDEAQVTLADDLGYGGSTLSLDRIETSNDSMPVQKKSSMKKTKLGRTSSNLYSLPEEYLKHLNSWVEQRKYQWKMCRENNEYERLLGIHHDKTTNESTELNDNDDGAYSSPSSPSSSSSSSETTPTNVRIFESSAILSGNNETSVLVNDHSTKTYANHYFRAAGGVNAIVVLCEAVKSTLLEVSDWGLSSCDPCEKIDWIRVSDKMKAVSDRWNPSFCRAIWQFINNYN